MSAVRRHTGRAETCKNSQNDESVRERRRGILARQRALPYNGIANRHYTEAELARQANVRYPCGVVEPVPLGGTLKLRWRCRGGVTHGLHTPKTNDFKKRYANTKGVKAPAVR